MKNLDRLRAPAADVVGVFDLESASDWSFKSYLASDTLSSVLYPFASGVHRVLVKDPDTGKETVLSQADIVRFLVLHTSELDASVLSRVLEPRGLPLTMSNTKRALVGFRKMCQFNRSSIGIVNEAGVLVGTLSLSDLRGLDRATFGDLAENVETYLASRSEGVVRPLIKAHAGATVSELMDRMVAGRVHRVWIVDADGKPVGQLSMSDVIMAFADLRLPLKMPEIDA